ncbi:hypothetical protein Nepgr_017483 [Nepenthes gracilis]|uniref:Uncharacterized protein n=1 Tax=Nepenthes gracilis TaxID=150966 RepID=A0AAD3XS72_NEPGR|nr:hypothetical protein Nepgr_017483 [Nepenthes gracilis]
MYLIKLILVSQLALVLQYLRILGLMLSFLPTSQMVLGLQLLLRRLKKNQRGIIPPADCAEEIHHYLLLIMLMDAVISEDKAVECCDDSVTPSPNVEIISSRLDVSGHEYYADGASHEAVVVSLLGSLSSAGFDGEGYEVPVPKEHDEVKTISDFDLQSPELLPADGDPTG